MELFQLLISRHQNSEYDGAMFSAGHDSAKIWKIAEICTEFLTVDCIHKILNVAFGEYLLTSL